RKLFCMPDRFFTLLHLRSTQRPDKNEGQRKRRLLTTIFQVEKRRESLQQEGRRCVLTTIPLPVFPISHLPIHAIQSSIRNVAPILPFVTGRRYPPGRKRFGYSPRYLHIACKSTELK